MFLYFFVCFHRITIPGAPTLILSPENPRNDGYHYFGAGLQSGQCGVQIDNIRKENHGEMKCFLVVGDQEVVGSIDIVIACKIKLFKLEDFKLIFCFISSTSKGTRN